jgi:hypothetical protein
VAAFFALVPHVSSSLVAEGWRWAMYSVLSGTAFLGAFFVAGIVSQTEPFVEVAGLWQRVCVLIGWAWLTMLALRLLREERRRASSPF